MSSYPPELGIERGYRQRGASSRSTMQAATLQQQEDIESSTEDRIARAIRRREKRRLRNERAEWVSSKLHALVWTASASVAFVVSDFVNVCANSLQVNRVPFDIGAALFALVTLAVIRMALWFPKSSTPENTNTETADFERAHPKFVLATTIGGILCFLFLTLGLWPVYRIFTPFLLALFWFGMIMSLHFLP